MGFGVTLIFYLVVGCGVAGAVVLGTNRRARGLRHFQAATAVVLWPLYIPLLLAERPDSPSDAGTRPDRDEMAATITQVEGELDAALSSLDGWSEDVLARESGRLIELRALWKLQAQRIREMDRLLAPADRGEGDIATHRPGVREEPGDGRVARSRQARRANLDRLRALRAEAHADLMASLAWVRELVSMLHLAKFSGAPASRAEELVGQIAAAVEGVSALTWRAESGAGEPRGLLRTGDAG